VNARRRAQARPRERVSHRALALDREELADAPLADVLLRGLGLASDDALEGVLSALAAEVEVAASLASEAGHLAVANALDGMGRRLDVAIEIRRRELRTRTRR
jgi:hypothetical protein